MKNLLLIFIFLLFIMNSCTKKGKVDLIVTNAKIYTVDKTFSTVESFVVIDGKIIETGLNTDIQKKYTSEHTVDAEEILFTPVLTMHIAILMVMV